MCRYLRPVIPSGVEGPCAAPRNTGSLGSRYQLSGLWKASILLLVLNSLDLVLHSKKFSAPPGYRELGREQLVVPVIVGQHAIPAGRNGPNQLTQSRAGIIYFVNRAADSVCGA